MYYKLIIVILILILINIINYFINNNSFVNNKKIYYYLFNTPNSIEYGLMYKKNMPYNHIALFEFSNEELRYFWMKNTYISLDMIFLDRNYNIVGFIENTKPLSLESLYINKKSKYVIESNNGFVKTHNLNINDNINDKFKLIKY